MELFRARSSRVQGFFLHRVTCSVCDMAHLAYAIQKMQGIAHGLIQPRQLDAARSRASPISRPQSTRRTNFLAFSGCVSQGATKAEALDNVAEAISLCLEVRAEQGLPLTIETRQIAVAA